ncbi:MAG: OsmC family peroxiredoxin [Vicinamibacterales bacterium]
MARHAEAEWQGALKSGQGRVRLGSGAYEGPYTFSSRFENGAGANPEELLGAALAGCFSMALANSLNTAGFPTRSVHTVAHVHAGQDARGFLITRIDLDVKAAVASIDAATFQRHVEETRVGCIIARSLSATPISVSASIV